MNLNALKNPSKRLISSLLILGSIVFTHTAVMAKPQTFYSRASVHISQNVTLEDARMSATMAATIDMYRQMDQFVKTSPKLKGLAPKYILPFALRNFSLNHLSSEPTNQNQDFEVTFKAWVDTDLFPENLSAYSEENRYIFESIRQHINYIVELDDHIQQYIQRLNQEKNPTLAAQIRLDEGQKLKNQFKALREVINAYDAFERKHFDAALTAFNEAIRLNPDYANAYFGRGLIYFEKEKYDLVISDFQRSIALDPNTSSLYFILGAAYLTQGILMDPVIENMNKALEFDAQHGDAYYLRGIAYLKKHNCSQAMRDLQQACKLGKSEACEIECESSYQSEDD